MPSSRPSLSKTIGVVGLGYVGLPLSLTFCEAGLSVIGFDIDPAKPKALAKGQTYLKTIPSARIAAQVKAGRFTATTDFTKVQQVDALIYCVPTPLTHHREPDMSFIENTAKATAPFVHKGMLVVLESTTWPGTTDEVVRPVIEAATGLKANKDFFLAFSPEREDPGNEHFTTATIPKVVGADTKQALKRAVALYGQAFKKVVPVTSTRAAEMVKIYENTFRAVNIALANEVKLLCERMGLDVFEIIHAAATKPFGFMPFYPGPGLGGHCLSGGETLRVRQGRGDRIQPLAEVFERSRLVGNVHQVGGAEFIKPRGMRILSVSPRTGAQSWRKVDYLFRRPYKGPMVDIKLSGNYALRTTHRHPMLVVEGESLVVKEARHLRPGDRVPRLSAGIAAPKGPGLPSLDLLSLLPDAVVDKLHVRLAGMPWRSHEKLLKKSFGWTVRDAILKDSLPARQFLEIEPSLGVGRSSVTLLQGRGNSHTSFPAVLSLTPDFCRFLGYYLSEGCTTWERGVPRVRLTFNRDETDLIDDCRAILAPLGVRVSVHQDKTFHSTTLRVASATLAHVLSDTLGAGSGSTTMRIAAQVMGASADHHLQLLAGLLRGDGDVTVTTGRRTYSKNGRTYSHQFNSGTVGYFSSSPELLSQVESLLLGLGFRVSRKTGKPQLRMHAPEDLVRLEPLLSGNKAERLRKLFLARRRNAAPRSCTDWSAGQCLTVKGVRQAIGDEPVYSVEVGGTHTFATTGGVFVHNCIPIDPFYLTWKAREFDFPTKFIELAGEINTAMPYHVVEVLRRGLADQGKSLKGSKVLILGVAYKRDIDDLRESPALKIMSLLQKEGAKIAYHDPHIPKIAKTREYDFHLSSVLLTPKALASHDAALIITDHNAVDYAFLLKHAKLIVDTRNVLPTGGKVIKA